LKESSFYLGTIGGIIVDVQCRRASVFLVKYPILFEDVFAELGWSK